MGIEIGIVIKIKIEIGIIKIVCLATKKPNKKTIK
jgi:hypothetical protein